MFDGYKDIFNQRGAAYHAAMTRYPDARGEEFRAMLELAGIREGQAVCDLPSGGGYLHAYLPKNISLTCVETAAQFMNSLPASPRMTRLLCELHDTGIPADSIDVVICLAGLHHVTGKRRFFAEVRRILKPGGRVCIADASEGSFVARFLDGFVNEHNSMGHRGEYLSPRTIEDLKACGLKPTSDREVRYAWEFSGAAEMTDFCTLLFGLNKATPAQVTEGIREHLGFKESAGQVRMNWGLRFIACEK